MTALDWPYAAGCFGKHAFTTRGTAERVAKRAQRKEDGARVNVYRCSFCSHFHIGNRPERKPNRKKMHERLRV